MRCGLIFSGGGTSMQQMIALARSAEQAGIDSIYLTEAWRSGFVGLAAIAMATERVEIGPYILNAYARSAWVTAMSAIDLDELSGGRLVLGV
ncbi:MAG: LLM class flavin-dependent oxidoreductase, partial [Gammaproteobacteria bacterium]|nr:LLM class flavin-dependent oxidoreductase [Gammaproteobacteria bacterium]